jgi:hypothetical protein
MADQAFVARRRSKGSDRYRLLYATFDEIKIGVYLFSLVDSLAGAKRLERRVAVLQQMCQPFLVRKVRRPLYLDSSDLSFTHLEIWVEGFSG